MQAFENLYLLDARRTLMTTPVYVCLHLFIFCSPLLAGSSQRQGCSSEQNFFCFSLTHWVCEFMSSSLWTDVLKRCLGREKFQNSFVSSFFHTCFFYDVHSL